MKARYVSATLGTSTAWSSAVDGVVTAVTAEAAGRKPFHAGRETLVNTTIAGVYVMMSD